MARRSPTAAQALVVLLALQGCAGAGRQATQTLQVETPGCDKAVCELRNDRGSWLVAQTPGPVTLLPSAEPLRVSCRSANGGMREMQAASAKTPPSGAGAVAGGAAGGAAVGAALGAPALAFIPALGVLVVLTGVGAGMAVGQTAESAQAPLRYPERISLPMVCLGDLPARAAAAPIGLSLRGVLPAQVREAGAGERAAALVTGVSPGGAAAAAGLREGDIVLAAGDQWVGDAADLEERVQALSPGVPLKLSVWRAGQLLTLVLTRTAPSP